MMQLIVEGAGHGVISRLYECDCALPECERQWLLCTVEGPHAHLGLCIASSSDRDVLLDAFRKMSENEENEHGVTPAEVIERGLALVGMKWSLLTSAAVAGLQLATWARLPEWMEVLPRGDLWMVRGCVFGNDLTRVPRALAALEASYRAEAPVSAQDLFAMGRSL
jgi:hypothetical protein